MKRFPSLTNVAIDPELLERALAVPVTRAVEEFIAPRQQRRLPELFKLFGSWDPD